jgi:branched-chain amino acid aminotransferase
VERAIDRTELYACDELFLLGTGAEIEPLTAVDSLPVGEGAVGPVTRRLWDIYEAIVRGTTNAHPEWRIPVRY